MTSATYRQLQADDLVPDGDPRRYRDGRGYIRLRWLVEARTYVEVYEHRLVMGLPNAEVHHENEDKGDNAAGNLVALTKAEHARTHQRHRPGVATGLDAGRLPFGRAWEAAHKASRRMEREAVADAFWAAVAADYLGGTDTPELALKYGRDTSVISRQLRSRGVEMRTAAESNRAAIDESVVVGMLQAPGARDDRVAREFGVSSTVISRIRREHGILPARPGRPSAGES